MPETYALVSRYHVVGSPQKEDKFVYAEPEHPTWFIGAEVTDDGRWGAALVCNNHCEGTTWAKAS